MRIADLADPVTAAKSDYLPATEWIGFTPTSNDIKAFATCQATIVEQMGSGYVIEYVVSSPLLPNTAYADDANLTEERALQKENKGRLVAVHRLRPTAKSLVDIVGRDEYERIQDVWGQDGGRKRWSVGFPIVERFDIVGKPLAEKVFGENAYRRLFQRPSRTLRVLEPDEREVLANLELIERKVANARFAVDDEIKMALGSPVDPRTLRDVTRDLASAMEGETEECKVKLRRRAAWLADIFVRQRQKAGNLRCDACGLHPASLPKMTGLRPRSLLDVHHLNPIKEGPQRTTSADFTLLCPTCHRLEHLLLRTA